jgi:hypothetical protein
MCRYHNNPLLSTFATADVFYQVADLILFLHQKSQTSDSARKINHNHHKNQCNIFH